MSLHYSFLAPSPDLEAPFLLSPRRLAVIRALQNEQGEFRMLVEYQELVRSGTLHPPQSKKQPEPQFFYGPDKGEEGHKWLHRQAMRIARRNQLGVSYNARALFHEQMRMAANKAGIVKPYNVFALYVLFVVGGSLGIRFEDQTPEYFSGIGLAAVQARVMASSDPHAEAAKIAEEIVETIEDIEKSVPQD